MHMAMYGSVSSHHDGRRNGRVSRPIPCSGCAVRGEVRLNGYAAQGLQGMTTPFTSTLIELELDTAADHPVWP